MGDTPSTVSLVPNPNYHKEMRIFAQQTDVHTTTRKLQYKESHAARSARKIHRLLFEQVEYSNSRPWSIPRWALRNKNNFARSVGLHDLDIQRKWASPIVSTHTVKPTRISISVDSTATQQMPLEWKASLPTPTHSQDVQTVYVDQRWPYNYHPVNITMKSTQTPDGGMLPSVPYHHTMTALFITAPKLSVSSSQIGDR